MSQETHHRKPKGTGNWQLPRESTLSLSLEERIALESRILRQASRGIAHIPQRTGDRSQAPLTCAQERMWFMHQMAPRNPMYNVPWGARLIGVIHRDAMERALTLLAHRHDILRTTYSAVDGHPQQCIHSRPTLALRFIDRLEADVANEENLRQLLTQIAREPFDLASDPPLRATLLRMGEDDHILKFVGHHIALDGWACSLINQELNVLYRQILSGEAPTSDGAALQYADVAAWEQSTVARRELSGDTDYWREKLSGLAPTLDLPIASIKPEIASFEGEDIPFALSADTVHRLKQLAGEHVATPFMVLAAALFSLLHRYTGEPDLAIGTPIAGRNHEETESLVGLFVNTLVLRESLDASPTFAELIEHVRTTCLEAYAHQSTPFDHIAAALGGERDMDRSPIVQIMLAYRTFPDTPLALAGTTSQPLRVSTKTSKLDLSLELWDTADGMSGRLIYATQRFPHDTIEALAGHFVRLLESGLSQPDTSIAELPILSEAEYQHIVNTWNAATTDPPASSLIHALFEEAVTGDPEREAVVCDGQCLTYRMLNARANQVAAHLRDLGAGPNQLIGVAMNRSTDLIVALLGILKAGAAYLPLDPTFPPDRLRYMMDDASVSAIIIQPELVDRLPDPTAQLLLLDDAWYEQSTEAPNHPADVSPDDLAYVMYTSGSTGNPKGVMVTHQNVTGFLNAFGKVIPKGRDRVGTNTITYAFDTSVEEIFSPLCSGGTLHVVPYAVTLDGRSLGEYLLEHDINTAYIVPDLLPALAAVFEAHGSCGSMQQLITGLAPKKQKTLQRLRDVAPDLRIINAYGPTEVTYGATAYEFMSATHPEDDVPIGIPFPDYQTYIVDEMLQPVPIGVVGEILIGGVGVARGYLNRPELTAERFARHPFSNDPKDRVYRTGDLAKHRSDGTIEFLGRSDSQVKIRGHRVELREIELALEANPSIASCHARIHTLADDDVRIAAYITISGDHAPSEHACIQQLQSRLPNFMIPAAIVVLPSFPLLPSGKIDPDKLPTPTWGHSQASPTEDQRPRAGTESQLAAIWADVMQIQHTGRSASFFDQGGHSLLVIRFISRVDEALGVRIPIRTFFENPTVEALAEFVDRSRCSND